MKDTTITFRLSEDEKNKINALAAERDNPVSQLIRELCRDAIKQN